MQAFQITYTASESLVVLGWPNGLVEVASVDADGSPKQRLATIFAHKKEIVFVGFAGTDRLVAVDETGRITLSTVTSGELVKETTIAGKYVGAALSPSSQTLFLFAYEGTGDTNTFALDLDSFALTYGPDVRALSTKAHVFGLDDKRAAYHFVHERERGKKETISDALAIVDFATGTTHIKDLEGGPTSKFGDLPVFDMTRDVGVRLGYAHRPEVFEQAGQEYVPLLLEVFDPTTLAVHRTVMAYGASTEDHEPLVKLLRARSPNAKALRDKLDDLVDNITSLRLTADGSHAWFGIKGGAVRRVRLDGGSRSPLILHGRVREPASMTLNDVFARNIINNQTLGVSPSGRYIAFGNPNEFFCADAIDLAAEGRIQLPARASTDLAAEPPSFVKLVSGGTKLVVGMRSDAATNLAVVDVGSRQTELAIGVEYGSELLDASRSPDGKELVLAYGGRDSLRIRGDETVELPFPPHTSFVEHLADGRVVFVNDNGAVITLEGDTIHAFRGGDDDEDDEDDEDGEDDEDDEDDDDEDDDEDDGEDVDADEEDKPPVDWKLKNPPGVEPLELASNYEGTFIYNDYFEQLDPVYDAARARVDGTDYVLELIEGGRIDTYRLGDDRIYFCGSYHGPTHRGLRAAGSCIVSYGLDGGSLEVLRLSATSLERTLAFNVPGLRLAALTRDGNQLVLLDEQTGLFSLMNLADRSERSRFAYIGPALQYADYDPSSGVVTLVEDTGAVLLVDSDAAEVLTVLHVVRELAPPGPDEEEPRATRRIEFGGKPVGRIERRVEPIVRTIPDDAELRADDEERNERLAVFGHCPTDRAEEELEERIAAAIEAYKKLPKKAHAKRAAAMTRVVSRFKNQSHDTVEGGSARVDIGRAFTIRGCERVAMGKLDLAESDFRQGLAFRYWDAYPELLELAAFKRRDALTAVHLADELLAFHAAKKGVDLRSSLPVYRALIHALVSAGDARRARYVVQHVLENLLPFLEDDHDGDKDKKKKKTKPKLADRLETLVADLKADAKGPNREVATELLGWLQAALATYPKEIKRNEPAIARLRELLATGEFLAKNGRWNDVAPLVDPVLAPHERARYFGMALSDGEKHRLGELFGLRGRARRTLGDVDGAAADFAQAIEFREVCHYIDAVDLQLGPLGKPDEALRLCEHFFTCPFNWSSEWFDPVKPFDCAYMLAARALARGKGDSPALLRRLYPDQLAAVRARLHASFVAPGHPDKPAVQRLIAAIAG